MNVLPVAKKKWSLTPQAFAKLLERLDSDREQAGQKYEMLRRQLVRFFEWRNCMFPEDHADETLDRVAKKLEGGEEIHDITNFCYGVARLLFKEVLKDREKSQSVIGELTLSQPPTDEVPELRRECFDKCLAKLPAPQRDLIVKYFHEEKRVKIEVRKQMAEQMRIAPNALRIRVHRLKEKVEECVKECQKNQ